jgi:hypothetical protein
VPTTQTFMGIREGITAIEGPRSGAKIPRS